MTKRVGLGSRVTAMVWTVRDAADVVRELSHLDLQVLIHTTLNIHIHNYQRLYTRAKLILHMREPST